MEELERLAHEVMGLSHEDKMQLIRGLLKERAKMMRRVQMFEKAAKEVLEDADLAEFPYSDGHRVQHFIESIKLLRAALAEGDVSKASLDAGGDGK